MISKFNATALASVLALSAGIAPALADETSELKAAVQALQKRLDQLEAKAKEAEDTNDRQTDQIAKTRANVGSWVGNFTWKGDFRYRNENIDQEYLANQNRDRIRVRTGFVAKVNDTVKAGGNLVIPAFAIERAQELLYHFNRLARTKGIPYVMAFLDSPMAVEITKVFEQCKKYFDEETLELFKNGQSPFDFPGLKLTDK